MKRILLMVGMLILGVPAASQAANKAIRTTTSVTTNVVSILAADVNTEGVWFWNISGSETVKVGTVSSLALTNTAIFTLNPGTGTNLYGSHGFTPGVAWYAITATRAANITNSLAAEKWTH